VKTVVGLVPFAAYLVLKVAAFTLRLIFAPLHLLR
jgi:hypothetical protein